MRPAKLTAAVKSLIKKNEHISSDEGNQIILTLESEITTLRNAVFFLKDIEDESGIRLLVELTAIRNNIIRRRLRIDDLKVVITSRGHSINGERLEI